MGKRALKVAEELALRFPAYMAEALGFPPSEAEQMSGDQVLALLRATDPARAQNKVDYVGRQRAAAFSLRSSHGK